MKLCALGLALLASTFALPTALAAERFAGLGVSGEGALSQSSPERVGGASAHPSADVGSERDAVHFASSGDAAFSLGFASCSTRVGAPARDTVTLAALGAVVLLVVRRLLQASS